MGGNRQHDVAAIVAQIAEDRRVIDVALADGRVLEFKRCAVYGAQVLGVDAV